MWVDKRLEDFFKVCSSKRVLKSQWKKEGVPFYRGREITALSKEGSVDNELFISESHYQELAGKSGVPKKGDIVITAIGTIGNSYIVNEQDRFYFKDASVLWLKKEAEVSSEFINYWLSSPWMKSQLDEGKGATVDTLTIGKLQSLSIKMPPLPEQRRIVGILDEAFDGLAKAIANAEANLNNARELFESHLNAIFSNPGPEWVNTSLEKVLLAQPRNGWSPPAANHSDSGTPVLTLSSVTGFIFNAGKIKFTSAQVDSSRHYWVNNGDLLITRSNTPELVGHVAVVSGVNEPTIYPDLIMKMRPDPNLALSEFLYYQLRTLKLREEIVGRAQGANPTMKKINKQAVQTLPIRCPSLERQKDIVITLDELAAETKRLEAIYRQKLALLAELKQSLLHKAFSGEL